MPSLSTIPQRRRRSEEEEDDPSDASSASSFSPDPAPSSTSKRPRLQATQEDFSESDSYATSETDGASQSGEDDPANSTQVNGQGDPAIPPSLVQNGAPNQSAQAAYKPGAIVRIKVTDFVTYTSAEFFPGPKLNMVIGPNGTGKSTLVCAICLGLGWGPQHLGRAKDTGEFVKHGCREATIEIELAGGTRYRQNPVVTRTIKKEGNKSTFTLNGQPSNRNLVIKLAQSFAIQVDNLCQFLPQDKVSEFAALTPIELLNSTQRAAAGAEMVELHNNLKVLRTEQKKLQADNQVDRDMLTNLADRQEMQRADVERMRQRAVIMRKIEMLEILRPFVAYKEMHAHVEILKKERDECEQEYNLLDEELKPAMKHAENKKVYCTQLEVVSTHKREAAEAATKKANVIGKKIEEYEQSMKNMESEIEAEKKGAATRRGDLMKIEQIINKMKRKMNEEPVEFDADSYNERIREKRRELREIAEEAKEINDRKSELAGELKERSDHLRHADKQLQDFDSRSGQQEQKLQRTSPDSFRAYKWLMENQDKFEQEVFGPPMVTCSIKDPKYANHVESLLQKNDFTGFTVQNRNDFRTLQRILSNDLNLHDVSIRTSSGSLDRLRTPMPDDQLRRLGFQGWAKDFLQGPEPVLVVLYTENRLHQTPISIGDISDETYAMLENSPISSWVAGNQGFQIIRRSEYGPGATSTRVRQVRPARVWTSQPVDMSLKRELEQRIQMLRGEKSEVEQKMDDDRAKLTRLGEKNARVKSEREELEQEKSRKQNAFTEFRAIPEKIRQQEDKKTTIMAYFDELKVRIAEIRRKQDQLSIEKAGSIMKYADAVETLRNRQEEVYKVALWKVEGVSDIEILKLRNADHQKRLDAKKQEVQEKHDGISRVREEFAELRNAAKIVGRLVKEQADLSELCHEIKDHTSEQLDADIESENARLALSHAGPRNLIQEFEERERQIERLRGKLVDFESKLADYNHAITEIRGKWEPKLDAIIKSVSDAFSDSFARIGCAGQVSLDKAGEEPGPDGQPSGNDFDQWSIQVHVKFRAHESLSLLDSHRQSGGERAVSTIFYLMALQSLSASPFRVVDEINQGMDPRNERMVHERLVDIACAPSNDGAGGGQYFLITPKLLSGLVYKPGMRVLCIVSGEHMPDDHNLLDFGAAVKTMRALSGRPRGTGRAIDAAPRSRVAA
ncbi:P-loop containing nucleoside triphosphate hydrolase protein [Aspergillus californicus]